MKAKKYLLSGLLLLCFLLAGCADKEQNEVNDMANENTNNVTQTAPTEKLSVTECPTATPTPATISNEECKSYFNGVMKKFAYKQLGKHNPLITQDFCADPFALVYDGRVYLYMSTDAFEYDASGELLENTYNTLTNVHVISSDDMVNWTDHGKVLVAGKDAAAKWANRSFAPAAACKEIDGKMKFFLYFANSGSGIGVLVGDSPVGPFTDPLGEELVKWSTPGIQGVVWLFDPAVFVDDDGTGYLYVGGGVPQGQAEHPMTARVVKLGDDMISLASDAVMIDAPCIFEDSGINKIGDKYYYSYCSNFSVTEAMKEKLGMNTGQICYMTSDSPMGPFEYQGVVFQNPGDFFGNPYNNHHCMFEFNDKWYLTYHTQTLESAMGIHKLYRSVHIDNLTVNEDGSLKKVIGTYGGADQIKYVNPYETFEAEMMSNNAGIKVVPASEQAKQYGAGNNAIGDIQSGDWTCVSGVDFGADGAIKIAASIKSSADCKNAAIEIRIDELIGEVIGYLPVEAGNGEDFTERVNELMTKVTGVHDVYFCFAGEGYEIDTWKFSK